jgi:hypothetical protein
VLATALTLAAACSDGNNNKNPTGPAVLPVSQPIVEVPDDDGQPSLLTTTFDLAEAGYAQEEFFLSGVATAFTNTRELGTDGKWQVEPAAEADYRTRILVYMPLADEDFSGTVFVEWMNVTPGFETPPSWGSGHTQILRGGHAWVGVSAQFVGIEGSANPLLPIHLKASDPERYGSLSHPGDSFSYDIFSQVAQALREPGEIDPLRGRIARQIIAMGESQSANRMMTYVNAVHPLYGIYDGYIVHSRTGGSSALSQPPQPEIDTPDVVPVRDDLNAPVLSFQTETDVLSLGAIGSRQADSPLFRLWEVAGTAHGDYYSYIAGRNDFGQGAEPALVIEENSVLGFIQCELPMNAGPMAWVFNAALDAMARWVEEGSPPPEAPRLEVSDDQSAYQADSLGNSVGGIRTPYVDAPAAVLKGDGNTGGSFCRLFGTTQLFDAATMASLYVDKAGYVEAVSAATDDAVAAGFMLEADGQRVKAAAALQWDLLGI